MTLPEFKAWFEGFTEDLTGPPNKKQWTRIQERVAEITGQAVSYPVYVDRYVRPLSPYWYGMPYNGLAGQAMGVGSLLANGTAQSSGNAQQDMRAFNSCAAMTEVGRADARSVAA